MYFLLCKIKYFFCIYKIIETLFTAY